MKWRSLIVLSILCSLLIDIPVQSPNSSVVVRATAPTSPTEASSQNTACEKANLITVKVMSEEGSGSAIVVDRKGLFYTLVTNAHVLKTDGIPRIRTFDGVFHRATLIRRFDENRLTGDDLAILQFRSRNNYQVAIVKDLSSLAIGDEVFASGFPSDANPSESGGFVCRSGKITHLLPAPMRSGYQLGYDIDIAKGMSGGPLLNEQGEVVGINGKHNLPLWYSNNLYVFKNGSPVLLPQEQLISNSWAIPINDRFLQQTQPYFRISIFRVISQNTEGSGLLVRPTNSTASPQLSIIDEHKPVMLQKITDQNVPE